MKKAFLALTWGLWRTGYADRDHELPLTHPHTHTPCCGGMEWLHRKWRFAPGSWVSRNTTRGEPTFNSEFIKNILLHTHTHTTQKESSKNTNKWKHLKNQEHAAYIRNKIKTPPPPPFLVCRQELHRSSGMLRSWTTWNMQSVCLWSSSPIAASHNGKRRESWMVDCSAHWGETHRTTGQLC